MPLVAPIIGLGTVALVLWTVAFVLAIAVILGYVSGVLHGLPFPLNQLAGPVNSLSHGITNACRKLEGGIDKLAGAAWHLLARYMDTLWHQLEAASTALVQTAEIVGHLIHAHAVLRHLVHSLIGGAHSVGSAVKTLEREFHGIEHRVKAIEHKIAQGIGNDIRIHIKALEREVAGIEQGVIPGLRAGVKAAEGEVTALQNFIKAIPGTRYLEWAAGIVAAVLSLEIINLLRCPRAKDISNQRGCSMWGALDDLLGLLALGIAAAEFDTLVHEAQDLTDVSVTVFDDVFGLSR